MKKIKLFALAIMAMLSTNAFADDWANTTFVYTYATDADDAAATINGFIDGYPAGDKELVTIPNTVKSKTGKTLKVTKIAANAFKDQTDIKKVIFAGANLEEIEAAFGGCTALADVDFSAATGLKTIAASAFAKAPIVAFDFSKTKLGVVNNILGTDFDNATVANRVTNATLTTLKLSAYWSSIENEAFAGCTALATVDFGTVATGTGAPATQAFNGTGTNFFAGCPITSLNFTGTKVLTLPATLLLDGAIYKKNESLTSVTLKNDMTALNAALSNCVNLATLTGYIGGSPTKTSALTTLVNNEFQNDAALTSFDFSFVTTLGTNAFAGTGLTKVEFAKDKIAAIPDGCFMECASLATVTWDKADVTLATIGKKAFAGTAITSITFPKGAVFDLTGTNKIDAQAFAACDGLKTVIWDNATAPTGDYINVDAFSFCSGVNFYTGAAEIAYWDGTTHKVNNVTFKNINEAPGTVAKKLTMTAYKNGSGKYYYKMAADANIAIAKGTAKVYSAYAEAADDAVLNMISYKAVGGKYQIANGDVCIIISETAEVEVAEGDGVTGSMAAAYDAVGGNALKMTPAATTRLALLLAAPGDSYLIYGWVNSAKGTGFQKITSGTNIPEGTLYAYAKEPADGARLIVRWYDEDGNLENEATAIRGIETEAAESGATYNVAGQKVNANYKGLVIKDGKKFMMK